MLSRVIVPGVAVVLALLVEQTAHGQTAHGGSQAELEALAQRWRQAAADAATALTGAADRLEQRRRDALAALSRTEQFFASHGDRGQAWRSYLQLDRCREIVTSPRIARTELAQLADNYVGSAPGLELSAVIELRQALSALGRSLEEASADEVASECRRVADLLSGGALLDRHRRRELADALSWFFARSYLESLVGETRRLTSSPNLVVQLRTPALQAFVGPQPPEPIDIRENYDGMTVTGNGTAYTYVDVRLVPSRDVGRLELLGHTRLETATRGRQGPVTVRSAAGTQLESVTPVVFDAAGFRASPTQSTGCADTRITGICTTLPGPLDRLAKRIAKKRFRESRGEINGRTARQASADLSKRFDEEVAELISEGQQDYENELMRPLQRQGLWPAQTHVSSTSAALLIDATSADGAQLSATTAAPAFGDAVDLSLRLHESMLENSLETLLADQTVSDAEIGRMVERAGGASTSETEASAKSQAARAGSEAEEPEFAIAFGERRPASVDFDDESLTIVLHGRRFYAQHREFDAMDVVIRYKLQWVDDVYFAIRDGEPIVARPGWREGEGRQFSGLQAIPRRVLIRRLLRDLPERQRLLQRVTLLTDVNETAPPSVTIVSTTVDDQWLSLDGRIAK